MTLKFFAWLLGVGTIVLGESSPALGMDYQKMFDERCGACHTIEPPPKAAPPFRGIVRNYAGDFPTKAEFAEAVATFVRQMEGRKVKFPHAEERFGKMPPFPYDEGELRELAGWIWEEVQRSPSRCQ